MYRIAMLEDITEERRAQEELNAAYRDLERRVQERTRALIALNTVASVVSRSLEIREIARDALAVSTELIGCEQRRGLHHGRERRTLELVAAQNLSPQVSGRGGDAADRRTSCPTSPRAGRRPGSGAPQDLETVPSKRPRWRRASHQSSPCPSSPKTG